MVESGPGDVPDRRRDGRRRRRSRGRQPAGRGARLHEHRQRRAARDRDPRRGPVRHRVACRPRSHMDLEAEGLELRSREVLRGNPWKRSTSRSVVAMPTETRTAPSARPGSSRRRSLDVGLPAQREQPLHLRRREAAGGLAGAGVAEAAGAQRDPPSAASASTVPSRRRRRPRRDVERDRAAAVDGRGRAVEPHQRCAVGVPQRGSRSSSQPVRHATRRWIVVDADRARCAAGRSRRPAGPGS